MGESMFQSETKLEGKPEYTEVDYKGMVYKFHNTPTLPGLIKEIFNDNYKIFERGVQFSPGNVVVDIGANEGIFSIMLAKMFPGVKIIACEPVPRTFFQMLRNVGLNGVTNIITHNCGVGKESGMMPMVVNDEFSGSSSGVQQVFDKDKNRVIQVEILSLDKYLTKYCLDNNRIRLMKMDIEGMEYDALYHSTLLDKVDYFVGEFHVNKFLTDVKRRDVKELATYVGSKTNLIFYETCYMAE
jgi:FkbM family methyltransferase